MKYFWPLVLLSIIGSTLCAQELPDIERILEQQEISSSQDNYEEIVNTLLHLYQQPLPLNTTTFDSLKLLVFLSDSQIDNILSFREKMGGFRHENELLLVPGISKSDLENLRLFIRINDFDHRKRFQVIRKSTRQELLLRIRTTRPKQIGYTHYGRDAFLNEADYEKHLESRFRGPAAGTLIKYKLTTGNWLQAGLTLENDPGEPYFTRYQKTGFDFFSAHVALSTSSWVEKVILGDFKMQFGQGLIGWHGFSSGKSAASLSNEKSAKGVTPYTSSNEINFLRGLALTLRPHEQVNIHLFVSHKKTDGNVIDRDSLDPEDLESASLYQSGYHRSLNESQKKHKLKEFTTGVSAGYNHARFRINLQGIYYNFDPRLRTGEQSYQQYNDNGHKRSLISIDYKGGFHHFYLFGETARSDNGALSTINGLRYSGFRPASIAVIYRRYDKKFISYYNGSFGEFSNGSNEEGVYIGIESTPLRNLRVNAYYDWFRYFAPRYRATIPGSGFEYLGDATYTFRKNELSLRFKQENRPEDLKTDILQKVARTKQEFRCQLAIREWRIIELRTRFDYTRYKKGEIRESGYLIYQDLILTFKKPDLKTQFRLAWFDTDSYNTRVYAYEHNVLYGYSFPAYYDKGFRTYLNLNWKPSSRITLYGKGGFTYYPNRESISSSLTKVEDNKLFDISIQLRVRL